MRSRSTRPTADQSTSSRSWRQIFHNAASAVSTDNPRREAWAATAFVALGLAMRFYFFAMGGGIPDSDTGEAGLMGAEALHGHFEWVYWDQAHGGTLGALPIAALHAIFGVGFTSIIVSAQLWTLAVAIATYWLGRTLGFHRARAALVSAVVWSAPAAVFALNAKDLIYFTPAIVSGLVSLAFAVRYATNIAAGVARWGDAAASGLAAGIGAWTNPGSAYLTIPAGAVVLGALVSCPVARAKWIGGTAWLSTALLGALPWIVVVLGGPPRPSPYTPLPSSIPRRFVLFFTEQLPGIAGLKAPFSATETAPYLNRPIGLLFVGLGSWLALRSARRTCSLQIGPGLLLGLSTAPVLWTAIAGVVGSAYQNLRYTYYLYPVLILLVLGMRSSSTRRVVVGTGVMTLAAATMVGFSTVARANPLSASTPLAGWLVEHRHSCVVNEYVFGGYSVGLASGGTVTVVPTNLESTPKFRDRARLADLCVWAVADRSDLKPPFDRIMPSNEINLNRLKNDLDAARVPYRVERVGGGKSWAGGAPHFDVVIPEQLVLPADDYLTSGRLLIGAEANRPSAHG